MRTPLYNAAKDDITNLEKYALYYYTDIEDEQNDTENEIEDTPVAVIETDFKESVLFNGIGWFHFDHIYPRFFTSQVLRK